MNKILITALTLMTFGKTFAADRNLCDELITKKVSQEKIDKCLNDPRYGKSDFYKAQEVANKQIKEQQDNLEVKTFTQAQLDEESFGEGIFGSSAFMLPNGAEEKNMLTTGDDLCKVLGYSKSKLTVIKRVGQKGTSKNISGVIAAPNEKRLIPFRGAQRIGLYFPITKVTCVRSKIENNPIFDSITENRILDSQDKEEETTQETAINEDSRTSKKEIEVSKSNHVGSGYDKAWEGRNK